MRTLPMLLFLILPLPGFSVDLIHPHDFLETEKEKADLIAFIRKFVEKKLSAIGMNDEATRNASERFELRAFYQLTKVENRELLDFAIEDSCGLDMCNYTSIKMVYDEQLEASGLK